MKQKVITLEEYIGYLIIKQLNKLKNKYENFQEEDFEDLMQELKLVLLRKEKDNEKVKFNIEYVRDNLNKKDRFKDKQFKMSCGYIEMIIINSSKELVNKQLGLKGYSQKKNKETGKQEKIKREEGDLYKIDKIQLIEVQDELVSVSEDLNKNIDLNMFYVELQKYANVLLCLMSEKDIKDIKTLEFSNPRTKLKFLEMFKELIINIDKEVTGFDNEQIKEFWIFVLKSIKKDKEIDKLFINTKIFKTFKDIYY